MSHFVECQTQIRDLASLRLALQEMGWAENEIEVHPGPVALYGYRGDRRPEQAEVIIPRQFVGKSSNDIGFARQADGTWSAIISEYDQRQQGRRGPYDQAWLGRLTQAYAAQVVTAQYQRKGWQVHRERREDGAIRVMVRR
jgi:hypothetical protein